MSLKSRSQFELAVNNHDEAVDLSTTLIPILYKTIMAPLVIGSNEIVGALLFVNRLHQDDFSNRVRKIAEVTAADISKILRENCRVDYLRPVLLNRRCKILSCVPMHFVAFPNRAVL